MVYQFAPQICPFDAVGNEIFALQRMMAEIGIASQIACELVDQSLKCRVQEWSERISRSSSLTIVHYSHGSTSHEKVLRSAQPKVLLYHNVTPARYFRGTHPNLARASELGLQQVAKLRGVFKAVVTHSRFSADQLESLGFDGVEVLPYVSLPSLFEVVPDAEVISTYRDDGWVNVLSVGQVSPHKCIEDCILAFDYFKRHLCQNGRLIIVGGWAGTEAYLRRIERLIKKLNLRDVIFTGQVSMEVLVAYYQTANLFLCMSEHEGFCVPVVEAMRYDIPVFAYNSSAIPETLRGSGVMFSEKHWPTIAEAMAIVVSDQRCRGEILAGQREQLDYYSWSECRQRFLDFFVRLGTASVAGGNPGPWKSRT